MTEKSKEGIVFLNKPAGETSFRSLGCVKKALGTKKVGHTGTLDKFATGLLIILTGRFTKLNSLITDMDKVYEAEFTFGRETDSLDPEGETVAVAAIPEEELIRKTITRFTGNIQQQPPQYSAVHIDGQRAHKLARKGIIKEMPTRDIRVDKFEVLSWHDGKLQVRIHCSKGSYVRSLARDLGLACGSRAYVSRLKRTRVGPFSLDESFSPDEFSGDPRFYPWQDFLSRLPGTGICMVKDDALPLIANGVPFKPSFLQDPEENLKDLTALTDSGGSIKAVLIREDSVYRYKINFN